MRRLTAHVRIRLVAGLMAALLLLAHAPEASAAGTLSANPTVVTLMNSSAKGKTTLTWSSGGAEAVQVHVRVDGGAFTPTGLSGPSGTGDYTNIEYGKSYLFRLFSGSGQPLASSPVAIVTTKLMKIQIDMGCALQCITEAEVAPHGTYADFHAETNEPATFLVQAVAAAPNADGTCKSAPLAGTLWKTTKSTTFDGQMPHLDAGTEHCYTVTAKDASGNEAKKHGTFKTHKRTVTVTIDKIVVVNDSDDGGAGEISFTMDVEPSQGTQYFPQGNITSPWTILPNKLFTIQNAPTSVKVSVWGSDDDNGWPFGPFEYPEKAWAELTLDVGGPGGPGETIDNKPYDITSKPWSVSGPDPDSDLKFTVHGKFSVSYAP